MIRILAWGLYSSLKKKVAMYSLRLICRYMPNDRLPDYLHFKFSTTGAKPSSETAIDT